MMRATSYDSAEDEARADGAASAYGFILRLIDAGTPVEGLRVIAEALHYELTDRRKSQGGK
jgi:hypothetical protein